MYSAATLSLCGLGLMGMGLYFALVRPVLLPEDVRYIGTPASQLQAAAPGLFPWLHKVFQVFGGYIFTSGILTLYLAATSFREQLRGAWMALACAGVTSIGLMTIVNFALGSDFRWLLLGVALLWAAALGLFAIGKQWMDRTSVIVAGSCCPAIQEGLR